MTNALLAFLIAVKPLLLDPWASEPPPSVRATLVVETSAVTESGAGPAIARRLQESGTALLRAVEVGEGGGPGDPVVAVTVRPLRGRDPGYTSTIAVAKAGRRISLARERCSLCTEGELVAHVERSLARLAPKVRALAE